MKYNVREYLGHYPNIKAMLDELPEELWSVFLPEKVGDLFDLEANIAAFKRKANERDQVMAMQKLCGLPFRPNETLASTEAKVRIQGKKNQQLFDQYKNDQNE